MLNKSLFLATLSYFFVLQLAIAGVIRSDSKLFLLAGVNMLAVLFFFIFSKEKVQKADPKTMHNFVREKSRYEEESTEAQMLKADPSLSESNIEQIKIKINKTKPRSQKATGGLYRFFLFLLALIGGAGIVVGSWETFDFLSVIFAAIAMLLFLVVIFKALKLWEKSIFSSLYCWLLILLAGFGTRGLLAHNDNSLKEKIYTAVSEAIICLKGEKVEKSDKDTAFTGYESTGEVVDVRLSGDMQLTGLSSELVSLTGELMSGDTSSASQTGGENALTASQTQTSGTQTQVVLPEPEKAPEQIAQKKEEKQEFTKQLTILEAIKHLITENNIPLSSSKTVKFTYVAMSSADYPYMKTALEKKMIGSTTNPNTIVSCDVYMVMKGLAQNRSIAKTADVKAAYRQVAKAKNQLNGCQQGAKLTTATL